jgi:outer membrane protein OmpA-like peptidoglycan-associated protein
VAVAAALVLACSSSRPAEESSRRAEERIERAAAPALPASAAPAASAATPTLAPPTLLVGPDAKRSNARPFSELSRRAGSPGARRDVLFVLEDLRFAPGDSGLDPRSRAALDLLAARLQREPLGYVIEIQGHADSSGDEAGNLRLGLARAESVRAYLIRESGLPREWSAVVSLGSGRPAADAASAEGRARNRRAVVLVLR